MGKCIVPLYELRVIRRMGVSCPVSLWLAACACFTLLSSVLANLCNSYKLSHYKLNTSVGEGELAGWE